VRKHVRERAVAIALSLVDQTKLVTAASELARNTIKYGGGGEVHLDAWKMVQTRGRPDLSSIMGRASPTSTWPCATVTRPAAAWASAWAVPSAWSTSSRSIPVREKARQCRRQMETLISSLLPQLVFPINHASDIAARRRAARSWPTNWASTKSRRGGWRS
jgi:hypothetical protein